MRTTTILAATIVAAATAGAAHADMVNVKFVGTGKGENVAIGWAGGAMNVFSGQLKHQLSGGTGIGAGLSGTYVTYCTDLNERVTNAVKSYSIVPVSATPGSVPMGAAKSAAIADLFGFAAGAQLNGSTSNALAAAFQLAVWEIVQDYNPIVGLASLSLTGGSFTATKTNGTALSGTVLSAAAGLFASIGAEASPTPLMGLTNDGAQDQVLPGVVPAPGTIALATLGLACAGRRRR